MTRSAPWPLIQGDCRRVDWAALRGHVDLLAGGPPCQPFSIGGAHRGHHDERNLWPEAIRALNEIRPRAFFFENVRGIARESFRPYFDYILLQLRAPHIGRRDAEQWEEHKKRLERSIRREPATSRYTVRWQLVNAADYGVPQLRWRVLLVGFRANLGDHWAWPASTHSREALLSAQEDGSYWKEHGLKTRPPRGRTRAQRSLAVGSQKRWRTLRDAIRGLPEPVNGTESPKVPNHVGIPGAKLYTGHSGSVLDWPAKSVKAGVHGCPGGEHIVVRDDGSCRYWTVRETARLQCFPDHYVFEGPRSEAMRQIGNAVPVSLASILARGIAETLRGTVHVVEPSVPAQRTGQTRPGGHQQNDESRSQQGLEG